MIAPFHRRPRLLCPQCGVALEPAERNDHICDRQRLVDYQMLKLRDDFERLQDEVDAYLSSPRGRFELWWATRERRCAEGR